MTHVIGYYCTLFESSLSVPQLVPSAASYPRSLFWVMLGPSMRGVEAMHVLVGLVTILLFLFAFVSFRAFRILVGVAALGLVGLLVAMVIGNREPEERKQTEEAKQQIEREKSAQRQKIRWSRVAPSNVELRDPSLIRKQSDEFTLAASLKNNSDVLLSGFEVQVTVSDCRSSNDCERIGEASELVWTDVPAHQVRAISGRIFLYDLPKSRGKPSIAYRVSRVYAEEPGDCRYDNPDAGMAWNALRTLRCAENGKSSVR
jgi:hypothetical protein